MSINEIIIYIMVFFAGSGGPGPDHRQPIRIGEKFEEGIMAIGALAVSMVGLSPWHR